MKPHNAYDSIVPRKFLFEIFLFFTLGIQSLFIFISQSTIEIPKSLSKLLSAYLHEENSTVTFGKISVSFPDEIWIDRIEINKSNDRVRIKSSNNSIQFNPFIFFDFSLNYIKKISVENISFEFPNDPQSLLFIDRLKINKHKSDFHLRSHVSCKNAKSELIGAISLKSIGGILTEKDGSSSDSVASSELLSSVADNNFTFGLQTLFLGKDDSTFFISQKNSSTPETFKKFLGRVEFDEIADGLKVRASFSCDDFLLPKESIPWKSFPEANSIWNRFDLKIAKLKSFNEILWLDQAESSFVSETSLSDPYCSGPIQGFLPNTKLYFRGNDRSFTTFLFNESAFCASSASLEKNDDNLSLNGNTTFIPQSCNLSWQRGENSIPLIGGNYLNLKYSTDNKEKAISNVVSFSILGDQFAALDSPKGGYRIDGSLNAEEDFRIHVNNAKGRFGSSDVEGSFSQSWNPPRYRFEVNGLCHPPDLNNWMPGWWKDIWTDFNFTHNIPLGSFLIEGIWGQSSKESKTVGSVETQDFSFRELPIRSSKISVRVDENETSVTCEELIHDEGTLSGTLVFPRKSRASPFLLEFELEGDYPFDDGRKVLGESIQSKLSELNATAIECRAIGKIAHTSEERDQSAMDLTIISSKNLSFMNFGVESLRGEISYERQFTKGHFDQIKLAGGISTLSFDLNHSEVPEVLGFNLRIEDSKTEELLKLLNPVLPRDLEIEDSDGNESTDDNRLNLSLQARGPTTNHLRFKGSGNLKMSQKNLKQFNLLGPLSDEIAKLKIFPVQFKDPIGLSFNELNAVFDLNHDIVEVSPMELSGTFPKVVLKGSINIATGERDLVGKMYLTGSLADKIPLPGIKNLQEKFENFADPLSKIRQFEITGASDSATYRTIFSSFLNFPN